MTNEIQTVDSAQVVTATDTALAIAADQTEFNQAQIAALKQLGVEDAPRGDLDVFFHTAKRTGLDPFSKQIYMIGRNTKVGGYGGAPERWETKYTIQTGIEGYRVVGHRIARREVIGRPFARRLFCGRDGVWRDVLIENGPRSPPKPKSPAMAYWWAKRSSSSSNTRRLPGRASLSASGATSQP